MRYVLPSHHIHSPPEVGGVGELIKSGLRLGRSIDVPQVGPASDLTAGERSDESFGNLQTRVETEVVIERCDRRAGDGGSGKGKTDRASSVCDGPGHPAATDGNDIALAIIGAYRRTVHRHLQGASVDRRVDQIDGEGSGCTVAGAHLLSSRG